MKRSYFAYLSILFVLPFSVVITFLSPLFENMALLDRFLVKEKFIKREKIDANSNFKNYKNYEYDLFRLKSFSGLSNGRFVLIPTFSVSQGQNGQQIYPTMMIYDQENHSLGSLKRFDDFSLTQFLSVSKVENPFFQMRFPEINLLLLHKKSQLIKFHLEDDRGGEKKGKKLISDLARSEIEALIKDSFSLNLKNSLKHILNNGPFIRGHLKFREKIFSVIPSLYQDSIISLQGLGNHRFLRFEKSIDDSFDKKHAYHNLYVPIESEFGFLFEINFINSNFKQAKSSFDMFAKSFMANAIWYFDYEDSFALPETENLLRPFAIIDYFTTHLSPLKREVILRYIYHHYFQIAKSAFLDNNTVLLDIIEVKINEVLNAAAFFNDKNQGKDLFRESFFTWLNGLKLAIEDKNASFFK